jgi:hypothetical protein
MTDAAKNLVPWASLFGSAIALLGLFQGNTWLIVAGVVLCSAWALSAVYFRRNRNAFERAGVTIEGLNLDSLHIANLRRRLNTSLTLQRAFQVAIINGKDLHLAWQYDGLCRSQAETSIEFSIDSENNIAFEQLDCVAFDLQNDPERLHPLRPALVGSDGVSKKITVPFLKPLAGQDRFGILLNCDLPGCVSTGVQYYTSSLSFDQPSIESASVHLIFVRMRHNWVRVYEFDKKKRPTLARELRAFRDDGATCEYVDMAQSVPGQSVRVYLYDLPALGMRAENAQASFAPPLFTRN